VNRSVHASGRRIRADWPYEFGGFAAIYAAGRIGGLPGDLWSWTSLVTIGLAWLGLALFDRAYQRGEIEVRRS
jgi:hypothetical protein